MTKHHRLDQQIVGEYEMLKLAPDDWVIFKFDGIIHEGFAQRVYKFFKENLPEAKIIFLGDGDTFDIEILK